MKQYFERALWSIVQKIAEIDSKLYETALSRKDMPAFLELKEWAETMIRPGALIIFEDGSVASVVKVIEKDWGFAKPQTLDYGIYHIMAGLLTHIFSIETIERGHVDVVVERRSIKMIPPGKCVKHIVS